jgi:hypothetical protein
MGLFDRWKRSGATAVAERPAPVVPQPKRAPKLRGQLTEEQLQKRRDGYRMSASDAVNQFVMAAQRKNLAVRHKGIDSVGAAFEGYDAQYAYDETLGGYVKCANADVLRTHPELREALFELGFRWVGAFGVWHHAQPRKGAK